MFNEFRPQKGLHQIEFIFLLIELYICTAEGADINLNNITYATAEIAEDVGTLNLRTKA